ncbi:hypothetical protein [Streptomyces sp. TP-A0874]|nr:hypothetical protein [Streptomyces sp. TP-A0874]
MTDRPSLAQRAPVAASRASVQKEAIVPIPAGIGTRNALACATS